MSCPNLLKVSSCRLMSTGRLLRTVNNSIKICSLREDRTEESIKFMSDNFLKHDTTCKAFGITNNRKVISELEDYITLSIEDGVSLIAIDTTTDKVIGAAINSLLIKDDVTYDLKLTKVSSKWKQSESRDIVNFWSNVDNAINIFDYFKVDCVLDLSFGAVLSKFESAGIGSSLLDATIFLAKQLNNGENMEGLANKKILKLKPAPECVIATCGSLVSQKIVIARGFQSIFRQPYQNLNVNGKSMSEMIQNTKCIEVYYLPLKQQLLRVPSKSKT